MPRSRTPHPLPREFTPLDGRDPRARQQHRSVGASGHPTASAPRISTRPLDNFKPVGFDQFHFSDDRYRTSTRSTARKIAYYRCLGSDAYRHLGASVCDTRPVRQDLLDEVVWNEIVRLLESPELINNELDRRL